MAWSRSFEAGGSIVNNGRWVASLLGSWSSAFAVSAALRTCAGNSGVAPSALPGAVAGPGAGRPGPRGTCASGGVACLERRAATRQRRDERVRAGDGREGRARGKGGAYLAETVFVGAVLTGADLQDANLRGADLSAHSLKPTATADERRHLGAGARRAAHRRQCAQGSRTASSSPSLSNASMRAGGPATLVAHRS
ncbi:pentapeptide repeat-containing protein [Streptomyces sp. NPDC055815]